MASVQHTFFVSRGDLTWAEHAAQSLEQTESIELIFERYNRDQSTLLHKTFKGYQLIRQTGVLSVDLKRTACDLWGPDWYAKVEKNDKIVYVQVVNEHIRTSEEPVPRTQASKEVTRPTADRDSEVELKRCKTCGQELPMYVYFQKYYKGQDNPRQGYCKVCQKYYLRWWHKGKKSGTGKTFEQFCQQDPDWKFETQFRL